MAIHQDTVWEVRTTGDSDNGGGWRDYGGASVDYSQQDVAELTLANCSVSSTTLTDDDAGGAFTAAMVGSIVNIVGDERRQIVAFVDTDNVTLDAAPGNASSLTIKVGGAVAHIEDIEPIVIAGHTVYIKSGTYVMTAAMTTANGTLLLAIRWIGYNATRGDDPLPSSGNQPILTCADYTMWWQDYNFVSHIEQNLTRAGGILIDQCAVAFRCKFHNDSVTASRIAIEMQGNTSAVIGCEIISDNGYGIIGCSTGARILYNYVHDCDIEGIYLVAKSNYTILFNIVDNCGGDGIKGGYRGTIIHNTVDGCGGDGIELNTTTSTGLHIVMNNQVTNNGAYGVYASGSQLADYLDFNNYYLNTSGRTLNLTEGANKTTDNPGYTDRAGGDFSGVVDSNAFAIEEGVG